jgi:hypothetical protein
VCCKVGENGSFADGVDLPRARGECARLRNQLVRELAQLHPLVPYEVRMLGLGEQLKVVHDPAHPVELVHDERERQPVLVGIRSEELEVPAADRERVAELVACVLDERALASEDRFQPVEHRVEAARHDRRVPGAVHLDSLSEVGL